MVTLIETAFNSTMIIVGSSDTGSRQECYGHQAVSVYMMPRVYCDVDGKYRPVGSRTITYISVYPGFNLLFLYFSILVYDLYSTLKLQ